MPDIINTQVATEVAAAVERVIDQRKNQHLGKIEEKKKFYEDLLIKVKEFERFRTESLLAQEQSKSGPYYSYFKSDPTLIDRVTNATAADTIKKIEECIAKCNQLYARFNRDTINISVVGKARQGKSTLLQRISGLPNEVIPAADGGDCTGTTSMIQNDNNIVETYAEIKFFSPDEMVEIVKAYIKELDLDVSVPSFGSIPSLRYLIDNYKNSLQNQFNADQQSLFKHLAKYITHFNDSQANGKVVEGYSKCVLEKSITVNENNIREYVAQYDVNNFPVYKYLAVKEVMIHTRFVIPQVGKIVLVDTIGLGDTSLGIEDKMLATLRNNSDAAFLVRFPASTGDKWNKEDNKLHSLIVDAMGKEMLDKWLYLVVNMMGDGQNKNSSKAMIDFISGLDLHFAEIIQVNCKDQSDVYNKLLLPSLLHLAEKLIEVDNNLIVEANKTFNDCYTSYLGLYEAANSILVDSPESQAMLALFGIKKWSDTEYLITSAIGKLSEEYEKEEDYQNVDSVDALEAARKRIRSHMPSKDWYEKELNAMAAGTNPLSVYGKGCNYTRAGIMTEFSKVNINVLKRLEKRFKFKLASIFFKIGRLGEIPLETCDNSACSIDWLEAFRDEKLKDKPLLREVVDTVLDYKISMADSLAKGVAMTLRVINPIKPSWIFPDIQIAYNHGIIGNKAMADFLYNAMDDPMSEIKSELRHVIKEASSIPNFSLSSHAELIRNKLVMNKAAMEELRDFYILNSATIWSEDFKQAASTSQAMSALSKWINNLIVARKQNFIILLS